MSASPYHLRTNKLKRVFGTPHSVANSTDTDDFVTPPRKRFRCDTPSTSSELPSGSSSAGASKVTYFNLYDVLQRCADDPDYATATELKRMPKGALNCVYAVKDVLNRVQASVKERADAKGDTLLETELYLEWLKGSQVAVNAIHNILNSKIPGTRKRIPGLGRASFTILYNLLDEFIDAVNAHHDGWSYRASSREPSIYPPTLTLVEECNDPSTDDRSDAATKHVDELLEEYDHVMMAAIQRYKVESARSKKLACAVGRKEHSLAKGCCLLSEQTGYGGDDNDMGDKILQHSRKAMRDWKAQYADEDEGLDDSDTDDL